MESSTANQITTPGNQNFFLSPQFPMQRQYEALRAYLLEEESSADVARRFGYSPGAFRVLCYLFRHDPQKRASFFRQPQRGPQSSPARDRVRDLAVAMRKRNLSVYDMQRELAAAGHTISINSLTVLLRGGGLLAPSPPRRRRTPGYREAGDRRRRRCAPFGSVPLFLPYPFSRSFPVSAFAGSHRSTGCRHRGALAQFADDSRRPGRPQSPGPETHRRRTQKPRHGPGDRSGHRAVRRNQRCSQTLLPGGLLLAHRPQGLLALHGGLVGTGRAGLLAPWLLFRRGLS